MPAKAILPTAFVERKTLYPGDWTRPSYKLGVLTHRTKHPKVILTVRHRILSCCSHFSHTSPNISPLLFSTHFIDLSSSKSSSDRSNMSKPNPSTQDFVPAKSTQPEQGSSEQGDAPPPCTSTSPTQPLNDVTLFPLPTLHILLLLPSTLISSPDCSMTANSYRRFQTPLPQYPNKPTSPHIPSQSPSRHTSNPIPTDGHHLPTSPWRNRGR